MTPRRRSSERESEWMGTRRDNQQSPAGRQEVQRRYADRRWKVTVKQICRKLGRYTYADVNRELRRLARPANRSIIDDTWPRERRANVGCYLPTDRQLQQFLARAEWSRVAVQGDAHTMTVYEYVEISALNTATVK